MQTVNTVNTVNTPVATANPAREVVAATIQQAVSAGVVPAQEVSQVNACASFFPMAKAEADKLHAGNRYCKLIKKGENSLLPESLAIEVPELTDAELAEYLANPTVRLSVLGYVESLRDSWLKAQASVGVKTVQYSSINVANVASHLNASVKAAGLGQLSEASISSYFEDNMRDMLIVAFADRLGLGDNATDAQVKKLEQLCNQTRDNLKKLASRKQVVFDEKIRKALEWALSSTDAGDSMHVRLQQKLAVNTVTEEDVLSSLGF